MTEREAFEVLREFDPRDEDELITLPDCEIDRYRRAIEVACGATCAPPVSRHDPRYRPPPPPDARAHPKRTAGTSSSPHENRER